MIIAAWDNIKVLPDPPQLPKLDVELFKPITTSLAFLQQEESFGASALSPLQDLMAMTNLYDRIDWYSLKKQCFAQGSYMGILFSSLNTMLKISFRQWFIGKSVLLSFSDTLFLGSQTLIRVWMSEKELDKTTVSKACPVPSQSLQYQFSWTNTALLVTLAVVVTSWASSTEPNLPSWVLKVT
ncbi:hypothetical protein JAAARDRAFT_198320 [Jaapia argillacea MUCL 33604]|uniref:Uncharacterized protein n=1 Tax=Jaapia argillacea MUCL 33604 TaxID=933084 RepID=A0A067PCB6_9AGAM|nr:hypothetical protein JAAARDRAFT_198320 [Jaapia argillacea MUCL 33604]